MRHGNSWKQAIEDERKSKAMTDEVIRLQQENEMLKYELVEYRHSLVTVSENTAKISLTALKMWADYMEKTALGLACPAEYPFVLSGIDELVKELRKMEDHKI